MQVYSQEERLGKARKFLGDDFEPRLRSAGEKGFSLV